MKLQFELAERENALARFEQEERRRKVQRQEREAERQKPEAEKQHEIRLLQLQQGSTTSQSTVLFDIAKHIKLIPAVSEKSRSLLQRIRVNCFAFQQVKGTLSMVNQTEACEESHSCV